MADRSHRVTVVVPCYEEEHRLDRARFLELSRADGVSLLFVDDGSRDGTRAVLRELADKSPTIDVLGLERNVGKGEAVRVGMREAVQRGAPIVGYADADLSTPPEELLRLVETMRERNVDVVVGSRVLMVGRRIERRNTRHALGRVFATLAAQILRMPFYDTQCGAKFFRSVPALETALAEPFTSRWAFDVELLGRLSIGDGRVGGLPEASFLEVPLREWIDVGGSKLRSTAMAKTLVELARIELELARRRRIARQ